MGSKEESRLNCTLNASPPDYNESHLKYAPSESRKRLKAKGLLSEPHIIENTT